MSNIEMSVKKWLESDQYADQREIIRKEVNSRRLQIDRSCFRKTIAERIEIANMKRQYLERIRLENEIEQQRRTDAENRIKTQKASQNVSH